VLGATERIEARRVLAMFLACPDDPHWSFAPGWVEAPADLCLLAHPLADALDDPAATAVAATNGRAGLRVHYTVT
jgi:hypothetical protein